MSKTIFEMSQEELMTAHKHAKSSAKYWSIAAGILALLWFGGTVGTIWFIAS